MASSSTDELITKYTMDPSAYVSGGQKVLSTTGNVISTLSKAALASDTLHGKIVSLASAMGTLSFAAAALATAGLGKITSFAIEQASSLQLLNARFAALNGSFDIAGQKIAGLQALGRNRSLFGLDELEQAGGILEEAGLNVSRVLPLVNTLGNALGGTAGKALAAAQALRNIAEGADPLRTLRQFGINKSDFRDTGGRFNRNGKLVKDSEATFSEIEAIIKRKFGNVDSYLQDTFARRITGLKNSFDVAAASFGTGFLSVFGGIADKVGRFFGFLSDSGLAGSLGQNLANGLSGILGNGDAFVRVISLGVAALERLPNILSTAFKFASGLFGAIKDDLSDIFKFTLDTTRLVFNGILTGINAVSNNIRDTIGTILQSLTDIPFLKGETKARLYAQGGSLKHPTTAYQLPPTADISQAFGKNISDLFNNSYPGDLIGDISRRADRIQKAFGTSGKAAGLPRASLGTAAAIAASGAAGSDSGLGGFFTGLYDPLHEIVENTRITASNTGVGLKSFALGGGPLGQIGVTPVEFAAFRNRQGSGSGSGRITVTVQGAGSLTRLFEEFAENVANQAILRSKRAGFI